MLQDLQIALEWANNKVKLYEGSKMSNPERYEKALTLQSKVQKKMDEVVKDFINTL